MDLHSIPYSNGRILDFDALRLAYGGLWHELLIDARLNEMKLGSRLLSRLITGKDPPQVEEDDDEDDLWDDDDIQDTGIDTSQSCLETQVMSHSRYDPVGISPKALATRFSMDYGQDAFPCLAYEVEWVKMMMPDRKPTVVPQRLIDILRRGGYFDTQRTSNDLWFADVRPVDEMEMEIVLAALDKVENAGGDIALEQIAIVSNPGARDVISQKIVCRYSEADQQYCIHEKFFLELPVGEYRGQEESDTEIKATLLGMYLAKEHPNGKILARYLLRNHAGESQSATTAM
jgi:hypothetical protein